ncbi:MAG: peptidylprolyl isomerase [Planctomycetes bacterium]|nr:peptidylprolyl isomerase [Planctomycetota bacterium]
MVDRWRRWMVGAASVGLAILVNLAGCKKNDDTPPKPNPSTQVEAKKDNAGKAIAAKPVSREKALSFRDCVILDPVPEDEQQPPDKTYTGKNAVKIFETIANDLWDKIVFTDNDGRAIKYHAVIATDLGDIHVDLRGDVAPNHVRNFVCLARAGYYDGMGFYHSINRTIEENTVAYVEAGCPRGTGEYGSGSIGYWLKPEISERLTHQEGVLGACQGRDPNSAACRFYLTAAAMPQMDGSFTVFGKVAKGLDVVRAINKKEVNETDRLKQPVAIRSVTIKTHVE